MHGSGFVIGSLFESDAEFYRDISREAGAIVLDCDYAKAPTHTFPAAYDDVCDVIAHVLANQDGHYDTSRLTIGGFSAGGTLALVVSATMPQNTFKGQPPTQSQHIVSANDICLSGDRVLPDDEHGHGAPEAPARYTPALFRRILAAYYRSF
ncbi:hypothetical protein FRC08_001501 [Ceratobasidium sp. 394]|nr:hypothetical protein FRC08_001501 [Ceratobasidium sp. 394]